MPHRKILPLTFIVAVLSVHNKSLKPLLCHSKAVFAALRDQRAFLHVLFQQTELILPDIRRETFEDLCFQTGFCNRAQSALGVSCPGKEFGDIDIFFPEIIQRIPIVDVGTARTDSFERFKTFLQIGEPDTS